MQYYICGHCHVVLGDYIEGEAEPKCSDHPNGIVELVTEQDGDI